MAGVNIVADESIPLVCETFAHLGRVECYPGREISNDHCRDADILLVRSITRVSAALLADTRVRFVGSATIGCDHIDTDYLGARGIVWTNAPGSNADSVVDYVISAFCRLDGALDHLMTGALVGIIGMGNVGGQLYRRLSQLGVRCLAYDPLIDPGAYPVLTDLDSVLNTDLVCIHAPLTQSGPHPSYRLLNETRLKRLRPGATLINAGRGAVVDNGALLELLRQREDISVVLDVWENEPNIDVELMKRVDLATPHIAGYSYDGKLAGTHMIYQACCRFLQQTPRDTVKAPPVEKPLEIRRRDFPSFTIRETVLSAYDIAEDDQRLRGSLLHRDGNSVGTVFDRLRKEYRQRREFSRFSVKGAASLPESTRRILAGLGFKLRD